VPLDSVETARLGLRLDEQMRGEFLDRLGELFEEFRQRSDEARSGDAWSVFFAVHPDPNQPGRPSLS
jgi:hypothetical protein